MTIRTRPASREYRENWERNFADVTRCPSCDSTNTRSLWSDEDRKQPALQWAIQAMPDGTYCNDCERTW